MKEINKQKIEIYTSIFPDNNYTQTEFFTYCPQCEHHKKKLTINLEKDLFHCWVCNFGGHVSKLIRNYGSDALLAIWKRVVGDYIDENDDLRSKLIDKDTTQKVELVSLPLEAEKLIFGIPSMIAKKALVYLEARNVSYKIIRMYNFHYCENGKFRDRIIIPSYDIKGKVNFFIARSIYNSTGTELKKYILPNNSKEDIIFNELFITWERPIVLVEGIFDCLSVNRNTIPLLGSGLSEKSILFKKILHYKPEVILMLDNDDPGKAGTVKTGKLLTEWGIKTFITEYDKKDPGELTKKEVFQTLRNKKVFTQSDIMRRILE